MIESIVKIAADAASEIRGRIDFFEKEIDFKANELSSLTSNLLALEGQAKIVREWSEGEQKKWDKAWQEYQKLIAEFTEQKEKFSSELDSIKGLKASLLNSTDSLKKEIEALTKEKETLETMTSTKDLLAKDLENINAAVIINRKEQADLISEIAKLQNSLKGAQESFLKANEDVIKKIESDRLSIIEREKTLAEKKKELDAKEGDLKTVEMRWKKIYESKGVGFKI